jgi:hypothetical protein
VLRRVVVPGARHPAPGMPEGAVLHMLRPAVACTMTLALLCVVRRHCAACCLQAAWCRQARPGWQARCWSGRAGAGVLVVLRRRWRMQGCWGAC